MKECVVKNGSAPNNDYLEFTQQLEEYIASDCWAIIVNGKFVFNSYETNKLPREQIIDETVRSEVMSSVHRNIFVHFFRDKKDADMSIYMFGNNSYCINVHFEAHYSETESKFTATFKKSQAYVDKVENNGDGNE
jgi:hypothetical protein